MRAINDPDRELSSQPSGFIVLEVRIACVEQKAFQMIRFAEDVPRTRFLSAARKPVSPLIAVTTLL